MGNQSVQYTYRDYIIRYDNWKQGMEQSFILNKRPSGKKELQIAINVTGELEAAMGDNNQLLLYTAGHPKDVKLVYDQLTVLDQNKKRLPARIQVTDNHKLLLIVDDKDAVYPITVDPLNHTPNQVDLDGQFVYSKVVAVNFNGTEANVIAVYPNPAHESFQLQFRNMKAGQYEMNLISPVGQVIQSKNPQASKPGDFS